MNEKGYLTDAAGNIVDAQNKQVWQKCELKNGEFPKLFPQTSFNPKKIRGDFDPRNPIILKNANGVTVDRLKRPVNKKGYLVDERGNVIDIFGNRVFDKAVLTGDDIPPVFATEGLFAHSDESLTDLMAEIEKANLSKDLVDEPTLDEPTFRKDGETSLDSQMDDTPANYNEHNQRQMDSIGMTQGTMVEEVENTLDYQPLKSNAGSSSGTG